MRSLFVSVLIVFFSYGLQADIDFAIELFNDGLYEEAILEMEKVIIESPVSLQAEKAVFHIAESYRLLENYSQAESYYRRLWDGYPDNAYKDKALFYLGFSRFQMSRFELAAKNFTILIEEYPGTDIVANALIYLLDSYYQIADYNQVIISGRKLIKDYENYDQIPELLLLMAKAYFANNIPEEGNKILRKIMSEYPDHNVSWEALELKIDMIRDDEDPKAAAQFLSGKLKESLPRLFEEPLRLKLLNLYLELEDYKSALDQAEILTEKFNNSDQISRYLTFKARCFIHLERFQELISEGDLYNKEIDNSGFKKLYEFYTAQAFYSLDQRDKAREITSRLIETTGSDSLMVQSIILLSEIDLAEGKYLSAVHALNSVIDSPYVEKNRILFKLAGIYHYKFLDYSQAIKYYELVLIGKPSQILENQVYFQSALCYEQIQNSQTALDQIERIDLTAVENRILKAEIQSKERYLREYIIQDHGRALNKILQHLYDYLSSGDEIRLKQNIITIYTEELKDYQTGLSLLEGSKDAISLYQQSRLLLKLMDKNMLEGKTDNLLVLEVKFDNMIDDLILAEEPILVQELKLRKQILLNETALTENSEQISSFIRDYPENPSSNYFLFHLTKYYLNQGDYERSAELAEKLILDETIDENRFHEINLILAEYFYNSNDDVTAGKYYQKSSSRIDLTTPLYLFHYAVTLDQIGKRSEAVEKLEYLTNNIQDFSEFRNVVEYYADVLRTENMYNKAISVQLLLPDRERDDDFYLDLSQDYRETGQLEAAKEALLYIVDKDLKTLENLALLQFETRDLEMADFTYSKLISLDENNTGYYEMSGRIKYLLQKYQEAVSDLEKVYQILGTAQDSYLDPALFAQHLIISLYRIDNRPRAETMTASFKELLSEDVLNLISMHEAIYYKSIDMNKSEKLFTKLLKKELTDSLKYQIYFWRGVTRMELTKTDEATEDFLMALNSDEVDLRNNANLKLGTIAFSGEHFQEALDYYYHVIFEDDSGILALDAARNFAVVCKTIEEWQKAVVAYEIILERWGDVEFKGETIFDIAYCHYRDHKFEEAIIMFQRAIPMLAGRETQAEAQFWTAESYFAEGKYEKAVVEFRKIGYNYGDFPQWAASGELRAAESYLQTGKIDKAVMIYERVVEKYGTISQWGKEAASRLDQLKN